MSQLTELNQSYTAYKEASPNKKREIDDLEQTISSPLPLQNRYRQLETKEMDYHYVEDSDEEDDTNKGTENQQKKIGTASTNTRKTHKHKPPPNVLRWTVTDHKAVTDAINKDIKKGFISNSPTTEQHFLYTIRKNMKCI